MIRKGYPVTNVFLFKNRLWVNEFSTRMHDWLEGSKRPPIKLDVELHRRCNLNCRFCSRRENEKDLTEESKSIEVSKERWLEIAEESGKMGVKGWNISGIGEPMCKPDLTLSVMEKLKEYNIFGEITTNGTLWTEEMVKKTIKMGWDSVCVSLDSPKRETHNYLRGSEAFEDALRTLYLFKKYKKKYDSNKPTVTINAVLNKKNYQEMPDLFLLAKDLEVDSIFIEPMIVYTEMGEKLKLDQKEIREFEEISEQCEKLGKKYGIEPNINCFTEGKEFDGSLVEKTSEMKDVINKDSNRTETYKDPAKSYESSTDEILEIPCYYPWFYMIITAEGTASHCGEKENKVENIKEKDLNEIWFGEDFEKERERFKEGTLPDYCNRCRPNVVGDARRIRKCMTELRDKEYVLDAISRVKYFNKSLKDKIRILKSSQQINLEKGGENCRHERKLKRVKESIGYKIMASLSDNPLGKKLKDKMYSKLENGSEKESNRQKTLEELKKMLMHYVEKNKELKDEMYTIKNEKGIHKNLERTCEAKRELMEIKSSLFYGLFSDER